MNAIQMPCIISNVASCADGSLSLRVKTPELTPAQKTAVFEVVQKNLSMLFQPTDEAPTGLTDVKSELETKTPSMRLRAALYVAWDQAGKPGEWEDWYRRKMNFYINDVKQHLKPV